mgnify:CR=1 FL=1
MRRVCIICCMRCCGHSSFQLSDFPNVPNDLAIYPAREFRYLYYEFAGVELLLMAEACCCFRTRKAESKSDTGVSRSFPASAASFAIPSGITSADVSVASMSHSSGQEHPNASSAAISSSLAPLGTSSSAPVGAGSSFAMPAPVQKRQLDPVLPSAKAPKFY